MSPFRELFVELTAEAFAIAKGIGEQAVHEAQAAHPELAHPVPHHRPSRTQVLITGVNGRELGRILCDRYGWRRVHIERSAYTDEVTWVVRAKCGHVHRFSVSERTVEFSHPRDLIDVIDHAWARADRTCYCVPLQEAA